MHIDLGIEESFSRRNCCGNWGNVHRLMIHVWLLIIVYNAGISMVARLRHKVGLWLEIVNWPVPSCVREVSDFTIGFTCSPTFKGWKHHCFLKIGFLIFLWMEISDTNAMLLLLFCLHVHTHSLPLHKAKQNLHRYSLFRPPDGYDFQNTQPIIEVCFVSYLT